MNSLRRRIDRFCVLHPNFGIPNLMLYIVIGNIAFYLLSLFSTLDGGSFYSILSFSWAGLKQGQLWRLLSFAVSGLGISSTRRVRPLRSAERPSR